MAYNFVREGLNRDEQRRLEAACNSADERLVVWTLLDTGLRVGEFCSLTRDAVDFQRHALTVKGKRGPYGSKAKTRTVPMSARVAPLLEAVFSVNEAMPRGLRGKSSIQRMIRRLANRAGISKPCSPHVLRHTFAYEAIRRGISPVALQKALGHENLETTQIYLNISGAQVLSEFRERW